MPSPPPKAAELPIAGDADCEVAVQEKCAAAGGGRRGENKEGEEGDGDPLPLCSFPLREKEASSSASDPLHYTSLLQPKFLVALACRKFLHAVRSFPTFRPR